ncbi:MAG: LLM class F420-dependent oxidoreductase [Anaerolineales bacterium]|jgi:probable F420-dependent oxidoreductase
MKIGVVFPQTEVDHDPQWIRTFTQRLEALGYDHVLAYEHVLGVEASHPQAVKGPYGIEDSFLSPLVLFSAMAALSEKLEFATAIMVLPQRDAVLVAKQAATLDVLSGGRLRLGVGVGWNAAEFAALGADFSNRGRCIEEQVRVLKELWTQPVVNFSGEWYQLEHVGIRPLPIQKPIPVWFGGYADVVLRRIAKMGAGWFPGFSEVEEAKPQLDHLARYVEAEGRSWSDIGIEVRIRYGDGDLDDLGDRVEAWSRLGISHLSINTMRSGLKHKEDHLEAIERFAELIPDGA